MSIAPARVQLLVDGRVVRTLGAGEVSPEGVKVLEIGRGRALVEVDGRRWDMVLGSATASSVVLRADEQGHFTATALVNGVPLPVLIDTGATTVALNLRDARRAGVNLAGARRISVRTAGGIRHARVVRLATVRIGEVLVPDVEATVSERNDLPITLLGMSFLNQVEWLHSGVTLTLTRRH